MRVGTIEVPNSAPYRSQSQNERISVTLTQSQLNVLPALL